MNVENDEFIKAIYSSTRFGKEKLNQLGYRTFLHHPTIQTKKGIQTPDGVIFNGKNSNVIIAEFKGHKTLTNMEKRINEDKTRIEQYSTINKKTLQNSLNFNSNSQNLAWFLDKCWIKIAGAEYFEKMLPLLKQKNVIEWEVSKQRNNKLKFMHKKRRHNDSQLNNLKISRL